MSKKQILTRWALVAVLLCLGIYSCIGLKINDNALNLLPGQAVRSNIQLLQEMGLVDRIFITLSVSEALVKSGADTGQILKNSAEQLGDQMRGSGLFTFVLARLPQGYEYSLFNTIRKTLPYLLVDEDYPALDLLISEKGIEKALKKSFMLLNSPAGIALKDQIKADPLGIVPKTMSKMNSLRSEFNMRIEDGVFFSADGKSCLIIAQSKNSLTDSAEALKISTFLQKSYPQTLAKGVEPRIIGSLPHTLANSSMIQKDLRFLLPLASVLLFILLGVTLRDYRAIIVFAIPFLAAPLAAGLTSLLYGQLSGLALGFGIVLLGIGVDFSIHLFVALTREEGTTDHLLSELKRPIIYAALTTSTVFAVLLFSSVVSHQQMAVLALTGVLLAVAFAWLLIPTIISEKSLPSKDFLPFSLQRKIYTGKIFSRVILCGWVLIIAAGMYSWPQLHYNGDLRVLDVADAGVIEDENHFSSTWGKKGEQAFVLVEGDDLQEVLDRNSDVYNRLIQDSSIQFQSFAPLLPGPAAQSENYQRWAAFWEINRPRFEKNFIATASKLGFNSKSFEPFFVWLKTQPESPDPDIFLGGPLEPIFQSMLSKRSGDALNRGKYLALTTVGLNGEAAVLLEGLETERSGITVLNNSKWRSEVEAYMRLDIVRLSGAAGLAVFFLVFLQFRRGVTTLAVLSPVLSALAAMALFSYLTKDDLNMMHLIMGIMVIGLSVDYGIFTVCSSQSDSMRSAPFAVSLCAASSLVGFGVLACAAHPALHALGTTVLVGIGAAWPTALLVSPVLSSYDRG